MAAKSDDVASGDETRSTSETASQNGLPSGGLFNDNVDLDPPFAPRQLDDALRSVKVRGRRRRLLTAGPLALVMGSGLALAAITFDFGGNAQVTQIGSDLGSSATLAPETGGEPQGSPVLGDGSSVGDSYTSGPTQMNITPVPTSPAVSLDGTAVEDELAADQPVIRFDLTKILAPLAAPTPEASSGVTVTAGAAPESQPTSTPTPPVSASAHTEVDEPASAARVDTAASDSDDATVDDAATDLSVDTTSADEADDEPGSEPTLGSPSTDDPDVSASGTSSDSSENSAEAADESQSGADPSTATMSTADDDSQTDLETENSSAVDDLAPSNDESDPDGDASSVDATSDEAPDGDAAADGTAADGASSDAADDAAPADAATTDASAPDDNTDDDTDADVDVDGTSDEASSSSDNADSSDSAADDLEGDGELVVIDENGDIITPGAEPTPVPQPVVLGASAQVSEFEIIIDISVIDGDGYSIGACGTTVNWGDGSAQDSACDPSCLAVDSSAPASGVDGQLRFSHVYEVRNVQVAPYITVFTGLECYGDSSTVTFGPLLITDTGIAQS